MANITFVDSNDNVIGYGSRTEAIEKGIAHRIARVLLFNSKGELLIQKRSPTIRSLPNRWDQSAAGHVDEREDYAAAAKRELREEVGVNDMPLKETLKFYSEDTDEPRIKKRFNVLYVGTYDGEIKIDKHEVSEARWIQPDELSKWMQQRPSDFTQGFIKCFEMFRKMNA
jgi:isopentenyldiphosphate isomerase